MKLDLYNIFFQVARLGSFSKAAEELYMSQPAVSQNIAQLENHLQVRLFTRTRKGVFLTQEGEVIYSSVADSLKSLKIGEEKIKAMQGLLKGELKIGVGDTTTRAYLLPYLDDFHRKYPKIKIKIINRITSELCKLIENGSIDLAICNLPLINPALKIIPCLEVHDIFVTGNRFKTETQTALSYKRLEDLPLIFLEPKSNSRQYVEKYLKDQNIHIIPEIELESHDLLLSLAEINLGVSCVVKEFSLEMLAKEKVFEWPLEKPIPPRSIGICYLKNVKLSPSSEAFLEGFHAI